MIPRELLKGSLKSVVLKILSENGRMYGYEITRKIEELSNGKIKLTYGALYPVLHKLESDGEVTTETENVNNRTRIYYSLTKQGDSLAVKSLEEMAEFIETIGLIVNPKPSPGMNIC